jgi:hypothetical protein
LLPDASAAAAAADDDAPPSLGKIPPSERRSNDGNLQLHPAP